MRAGIFADQHRADLLQHRAQARGLRVLVVVVISPQPVIPSSVVTSTNRNSPQYEALGLYQPGPYTGNLHFRFCLL